MEEKKGKRRETRVSLPPVDGSRMGWVVGHLGLSSLAAGVAGHQSDQQNSSAEGNIAWKLLLSEDHPPDAACAPIALHMLHCPRHTPATEHWYLGT